MSWITFAPNWAIASILSFVVSFGTYTTDFLSFIKADHATALPWLPSVAVQKTDVSGLSINNLFIAYDAPNPLKAFKLNLLDSSFKNFRIHASWLWIFFIYFHYSLGQATFFKRDFYVSFYISISTCRMTIIFFTYVFLDVRRVF